MPYRILSIAPTSFFADYGCHVRILEEVRALQQLGHQVTLCTYHTGDPVPGIRIVRMPRLPWQRRVRIGSHWHKPYFDLLLTATALVAAIRQRVDVVHAHLHEGALIGAVVAKLLRCPLIFDYQGSLTGEMLDHGFLSARSPLLRLFTRLERWINGLPDVIITSSAQAQAQLAATSGPLGEVPVRTDRCRGPGLFSPPAQGRLRGCCSPHGAGHVRSSGRPPRRRLLGPACRLSGYPAAAARCRAGHSAAPVHALLNYLIMGYPGLEQYRRMAYDLQLLDHVTFTGRIPYSQAPQHLSLGDIAVAPKLSETEGNGMAASRSSGAGTQPKLPPLPLVILNYMAMGLPTVAFATAVAQELLGPHGV